MIAFDRAREPTIRAAVSAVSADLEAVIAAHADVLPQVTQLLDGLLAALQRHTALPPPVPGGDGAPEGALGRTWPRGTRRGRGTPR